ncbi:MAG: glycosyltransferase family 4 protein [Acidimicrobiales bacterium]
MSLRIAFVVPRYGEAVVGGAEYAARMLAERLAAMPGHEVSVYTTCAVDSSTWRNVLTPGETVGNGVVVRRFRSAAGRDAGFEAASDDLMASPEGASMAQAYNWVDLQGPRCPELVEAVIDDRADVTAYYPYLYYPTVRGLPRTPGATVLHAAAHDEWPIRLPVFTDVFGRASGLVHHTNGERRFVEASFPVAHVPSLVLGLGVEPPPGLARGMRPPELAGGAPAAVGPGSSGQGAARYAGGGVAALAGRPYVICVGRVDEGKGTSLLAKLFAAYKLRRPGPLALVLVGPVVSPPPASDDVIIAGRVDDATKWSLLAGALALAQPSSMESFSLALLEGFAAGLPGIVNRHCAATMEHALASGAALGFGSYASFEAIMDALVPRDDLRRQMGEAGQRYVLEQFSWELLIERYSRFVRRLAERAAAGAPRRRGGATHRGGGLH